MYLARGMSATSGVSFDITSDLEKINRWTSPAPFGKILADAFAKRNSVAD
jgi:hypothetical protein